MTQTLLALLIAVAIPTKPTAAKPTKTGVVPTAGKHKFHDLVDSIPSAPKGLKTEVVSPADFHVTATSGRLNYDGRAAGLQTKPSKGTNAEATFDVPTGMKLAWVDCRIDVEKGSSSTPPKKKLQATFMVERVDYAAKVGDDRLVRMGQATLTMSRTHHGMHWRGMTPENQVATNPEHTYVIQLFLGHNDVDRLVFRGCRVGYRK